MTAAIRVEELTHQYPAPPRKRARGSQAVPARLALDHVNLEVPPGQLFAILGPNGGGKTTLFRILATMLRPTSGTASVFGCDVAANPAEARRQLGVVFQSPSLDLELTAYENLRHGGHLYGVSGATLKERINHWLARLGLADRAGERVKTFSGGMRRRVELAKSLLHRPRLLLLDEPATGLDPAARRDLWDILVHLRDNEGVSIALTTHLMDEADRSDALAILSAGKLVARDTPGKLKARIGGDIVAVAPLDTQPDAAEALRTLIADRFGPWADGGQPAVIDGKVHLERRDGPAFVAQLGGALAGKIQSITVGQPTLEDVFMHLTGRSLGEDEEKHEGTKEEKKITKKK